MYNCQIRLILSLIILLVGSISGEVLAQKIIGEKLQGKLKELPKQLISSEVVDIYITFSDMFKVNIGSFRKTSFANVNFKYDNDRILIEDARNYPCSPSVYGVLNGTYTTTINTSKDNNIIKRMWKHKWNKLNTESEFKCFRVSEGVVYEFKNKVKNVNTKTMCDSMCSVLIHNSNGMKHRESFISKMKSLFENFDPLNEDNMFSILLVKSRQTNTFIHGDIVLIPSIEISNNSQYSIEYKRRYIIKNAKSRMSKLSAVYGKDCPICADYFKKSMSNYLTKQKSKLK